MKTLTLLILLLASSVGACDINNQRTASHLHGHLVGNDIKYHFPSQPSIRVDTTEFGQVIHDYQFFPTGLKRTIDHYYSIDTTVVEDACIICGIPRKDCKIQSNINEVPELPVVEDSTLPCLKIMTLEEQYPEYYRNLPRNLDLTKPLPKAQLRNGYKQPLRIKIDTVRVDTVAIFRHMPDSIFSLLLLFDTDTVLYRYSPIYILNFKSKHNMVLKYHLEKTYYLTAEQVEILGGR